MALIKCHECQQDISDQVDQCVHCGVKTLKHQKEQQQKVAITGWAAIALILLLLLYFVYDNTELMKGEKTVEADKPALIERCTYDKGNTEMMQAYALMVNANQLLCAKLNKICSTTKPDVLYFECQESRSSYETISYWYHKPSGKVLPKG